MRSKIHSILFALAIAATAGAAQAQATSQAPAASSAGPMSASPDTRAARMAAHQACANDAGTYCPGKEGRERMACMHEHMDKLSPGCKAAVAKLPAMQGGAARP
jgi:hypothetical protein